MDSPKLPPRSATIFNAPVWDEEAMLSMYRQGMERGAAICEASANLALMLDGWDSSYERGRADMGHELASAIRLEAQGGEPWLK